VRPREVVLTPLDVGLLDLLGREATLVEACRRLGISRDRGVYRLHRLERATGHPLVLTRKGGQGHGGTRLTSRGRSLLERGAGALLAPPARARRSARRTELAGTYARTPTPTVHVPGGPDLAVAFAAGPGDAVRVAVDPEAILVARHRFPTSARNVLPAVVRSIHRTGPGTGGGQRLLRADVGRNAWVVAVTEGAIRSLSLAPGRRVLLYVKATAIRRLVGGRAAPTRGSLPS
jgi:molybdate transport repressor ModE-like protein